MTKVASVTRFFNEMKAEYNAAKTNRFTRARPGVQGFGTSADWHFRSESQYLRLVELARDIDRNDMIVGSGISRAVDLCLQDGMRLDPMTGDPELNEDLKARWNDYSTDRDQVDAAGERDFHAIERSSLRAQLVDGDFFGVGLREGPLQMFESHRVRTPTRTRQNVVQGILIDEQRRHLEVWISREDLDPQMPVVRTGEVTRVPVRDEDGNRQVFQTYAPRRVSQTRGVTAMAPIAEACSFHDDIQYANLVRQQIVSCFAIIREKEASFDTPEESDTGTGPSYEQDLFGNFERTIEEIYPGMEWNGAPGEKLTGFAPNIPSPESMKHALLILSFIAVNIGIPLQVMLMDPSQTNFSGWRGAMDVARQGFRALQHQQVGQLHRPFYKFKLRQWIADDLALARQAARLGDAFFRHQWQLPRFSYIEPLKDAQADAYEVRTNLTSPRRKKNERGRDWAEIVSETVEDNALAITTALRAAEQITTEFPDADVHWRELISLPTPEGVNVTLAPDAASGDGETPPPTNPPPNDEGTSDAGNARTNGSVRSRDHRAAPNPAAARIRGIID